MGVKERKARAFKKREEEILKTSHQLLKEMDPPQMTMQLIAEETEIGCGTIYKHFKSKDEIYATFMFRRREKFDSLLDSISNGGICSLNQLIHAYFEYCFTDLSDYRVYKSCEHHCQKDNLTDELRAKIDRQFEEKLLRVEKIIKHSLGETKGKYPEDYYACAAWGMLRGSVDAWIEGKYQTKNLDRNTYCNVVEEMLTRNMSL